VDKVNNKVIFLVEADLDGYLAIGFGSGMSNVDMVIIKCFSGSLSSDVIYNRKIYFFSKKISLIYWI
jgi:hypothetical protein